MKALILLADAASAHPDGTFSLLRAGITEVTAQAGQGLVFRGAFVARITGMPSEAGQHALRIRVLTEDGQPVAPDLEGSFVIPPGGGATQVVANFNIKLPAPGRYSFAVLIDREEKDSWELRAKEAPAAG